MNFYPYVFAYDSYVRVVGAILITLDSEDHSGVWDEQIDGLAEKIAQTWPGMPVYCGENASLAAALRQWLPDVRERNPESDGTANRPGLAHTNGRGSAY